MSTIQVRKVWLDADGGVGVLGEEFIKLGIIEEIITVLRNVEPSSEFELQLVAAGICALASLCLYDIGKLT